MKKENEKGTLIIETILVMIPVLFVVVFMMTYGFFLYERWNVQLTAQEVATRIGDSYPLIYTDLWTGIQDYDEVKNVSKYRYLGGSSKTDKANVQKGTKFGKDYLRLVSFAKSIGNPEIQVEIIHDGFSARHVKATVTEHCRLPFAEGFEILHLNGTRTFTATGEAVCTDIIDYVSGVNYLKNGESIIGLNKIFVVDLIDSVLGMIKKVASAVDTYKG